MQATKKKGLLENAFQGAFWNSKITSANVGKKEMWLGYVFGPFGVMVLNSIVISYFNQFLTDVLGFTASKGAWVGTFMVLFPLLSKILDAITNVIMGKIFDKTTCRQGKLRPWFILSIPIIIVSVICMFWVPVSSVKAQAVWIIICYNLFCSVGYTMWYMGYEMMAALSTRNIKQRSNNSMAGTITKNIGTGMLSILFPTILTGVCRMVGTTRQGYLVCMCILCALALPCVFIQYFYTRERITEERRNQYGTVNATAEQQVVKKEAGFAEQFKACIKDKYWVMMIVMILLYQIFSMMKTVALVYYSG